MNYTNREVVRRLKQYDMFLNSLNLTTDTVQKERICDQLDKIEKQILLETNAEYEEEYMLLMGKEAKLFDEEKARLRSLITLITSRREYLEERKAKHKKITGSLVELTTFLGEDNLTYLKKKLKTIEKYEENKLVKENLIKDMKSLDVKISEASRNVKTNTRLNDMLESKMISVVEKALKKLDLYKLVDRKSDILKKHSSLEYAVSLAKDNLKSAKELNDSDMILECNAMLSQISIEFSKYNEEVNILKLIEIYDKPVNSYDDLLDKRKKLDEILKNITDSSLYLEINDELSKEYNTIKLEKQDIKNYENLKAERDKKNKRLYEIEEENNSKEFKQMLDSLIKNESKYYEEQIRIARREESREREKRLQEEQKLEASRVRRQKLIEEARLKDQQERAEKLKELQEKTVINTKREKDRPIERDKKLEMGRTLEEELPKEEIKNPLKNKTFEEVIAVSDDFDTDELFENTKIVPNRVNRSNPENSIFSSYENNSASTIDNINIDNTSVNNVGINDSSVKPLEDIEIPVWSEPIKSDTTVDLFKEEEKPDKIEIKEEKTEDKKENKIDNTSKKTGSSIYDILENNENIIWKTTDTKGDTQNIPVIENKNLKPEIVENKNAGMSFPELGSKDGDILWKETL